MSAVIQLTDFHISALQMEFIEPATDGDVEIVASKSGFDYTVSKKRDHDLSYRMKLIFRFQEVDTNDKPIGCKLKIAIIGFFQFPEETDEENRAKLIRLNGVSILYGILRGVVGTVSGLQPGGRITLPAIMPNEIVAMVEAGKQKQQEAATEPHVAELNP